MSVGLRVACPLEVARSCGIVLVDDPNVHGGYLVERDPLDPTVPGSHQVADHSFVVRAATRPNLVAGAIQVLAESLGGLVVTTGHHRSEFEHRALHIDAGRHYFDPESLLELIRLAAWCRLNVINLHFSEVHGYRLESVRHPEVVADQHLTKADIAKLKAEAARLGIRIIPGFDMPGHLNGLLEAHPWARLRTGDGQEFPGALDITNPKATGLIWDLLDEVVDIFQAEEVTIGGDEFLDFGTGVDRLLRVARKTWGPEASETDAWIGFINDTVGRLAARGVRAGVYNDGLHVGRLVDLDRGATVHYWTRWGAHMASPQELEARGFRLVNWDGNSLYFTLRNQELDKLPTFESVWQGYDPHTFPDKAGAYRVAHPAGTCFSIWCDHPEALSSAQIVTQVIDPLFAYGTRTWPWGRQRGAHDVTTALAALRRQFFNPSLP